VGVIRDGKQYFFGFGNARPDAPVERKTVFEIGSITKTFTGLLLAAAVRDGKVQLDQTANSVLPPALKLPSRNGREITLRHLATHRSGLPEDTHSTASDSVDLLIGNPAGLSISRPELEAWLKTATLDNDPGEAWVYSNLGASMLAFALEAVEGRPWAELVADLVTSPLQMSATRLMDGTAVPEKALGYDILGREVSADGLKADSAYASAGALRSNIEDMLRYAALQVQAAPQSLADLAAFAQRAYGDGLDPSPLHPGVKPFKSGLLLERTGEGDVPDVGSKNGATGAFMSDIQFSPGQHVATVVLTNRMYMSSDPFGPVTKMNQDLLAAVAGF
jgi:CubicO group peptidase (beta-lactamase class C family)